MSEQWRGRGRRRLYLYRARWVDGRAVNEYLGPATPAARRALAEEQEQKRWRKAMATYEAEAPRRLLKELDRQIELAEQLLAFFMTSAGYHRHRGEWRRKRGGPLVIELPPFAKPKGSGYEMRYTLDRTAADDVIRRMAPDGGERAERIRGELQTYIADLAGPGPSSAVQASAEAAGLAWLFLRWAEAQAAANVNGSATLVHQAHRRHQAALRTVAQARRLSGR